MECSIVQQNYDLSHDYIYIFRFLHTNNDFIKHVITNCGLTTFYPSAQISAWWLLSDGVTRPKSRITIKYQRESLNLPAPCFLLFIFYQQINYLDRVKGRAFQVTSSAHAKRVNGTHTNFSSFINKKFLKMFIYGLLVGLRFQVQ